MVHYLFILHIDGEDAIRADADCADDVEALKTAENLTELCDVDVWRQDTLLASLKRETYLAKAC